MPEIHSLKEIGISKKLANIGDTITNTAFSFALSQFTGIIQAKKVSQKILGNAIKNAEMKNLAKNRSNTHDLADAVEAFVGYMYIIHEWTIEHIAQRLISYLEEYYENLESLQVPNERGFQNEVAQQRKMMQQDHKNEIDSAIYAFEELLKEIINKIQELQPDLPEMPNFQKLKEKKTTY